jgi:hypothetical protein
VPGGREIENGQSPVAEGEVPAEEVPFAIWPAVTDEIGHRGDCCLVNWTVVFVDDATDAAHRAAPSREIVSLIAGDGKRSSGKRLTFVSTYKQSW